MGLHMSLCVEQRLRSAEPQAIAGALFISSRPVKTFIEELPALLTA
jgi:hypothetical protein